MANILVLYHSQEYGHTEKMAQAVADGAAAAGAKVRLVNTNRERLNVEDYRAFDAAAFGSPDYYSYIAGGMKMFLDDWYIAKKSNPQGLTGKPYGLFYSHGGGGKVIEPMEKLFAKVGKKVSTAVESRGEPDDKALQACRELGAALAKAK